MRGTMRPETMGLGVAALLAACAAENAPTVPTDGNPDAVAALTAVYDTAMDISGFGSQGHAYQISSAGLVVGDNNGLPFSWQQPVGPLRTLALPATMVLGGATSIAPGGKWIAGYGGQFGFSHAVLWDAHRNPVDLGTLGGTSSMANAVDNNGTVVGWSETTQGVIHAFRFPRGGRMMDMGVLPGSPKTAQMQAWDLNAKEIVGCGNGPSGNYDMWSWTAGGGFKNLGPGVGFTCANAVNAKGVIVGNTDQFGGDNGFTWSAGRGFILHAATFSFAHDINDKGYAAGESDGFFRAYVADPRGAVVYLPPLVPGSPQSDASAHGINVCGDAVGWSSNPFIGETHAVWWPGHQCP